MKLANEKATKYVTMRGNVPKSSKANEDASPVGPWMLYDDRILDGEYRLIDDSVNSRDRPSGHNSETYTRDRHHLPIDILFSTLVLAPGFMALALVLRFPISDLALA